MAKELYPSVNGVSKRTKEWYCSINSFSRRVKAAYCSENGISKLFYSRGSNRLLKQNYEHDETGRFTFGLADVASTVRYALEQMLLKYEGSVYPVFIEQTKAHFNEIVAWCVRHVPDGAQLVVQAYTGYSSSQVDSTAWFEIMLNWLENPTLERTVTSSEIVNGYKAYYYTDNPVSWSRINFSIRTTGPQFPRDPVSPTSIGTRVTQYFNFIGTRSDASNNLRPTWVSNLGCYFTEYELPQSKFYPKYQDYLLYWDFTLTGNKIDYNRNIWLMTENTIQTDPLTGQKYILSTITLPAWLGTHLFADLEFELWLGGTLSLHNTYNEQTERFTYYDTTLFTYRERYYFDVKQNKNNKAYGVWRWFNTDLEPESYEWEDHGIGKFTFNVTYEGKVENDSIDYNYGISHVNDIQIGWDKSINQYPFSVMVYRIAVKRTPINSADLYFYSRYSFQHSPEGTDIRYNMILSQSMDDFIEYLGTNKTFIFAYQESTVSQVYWQIDLRDFGGYARTYIRSPGTNGHTSRIYIPVNRIASANGKYMRVSARAYSYTTNLQFGVAYIDGDSLVDETLESCSLTKSLEKFYGQITSPTVDYMWFEDNGDGRIVMISTVKISDTEDEALH